MKQILVFVTFSFLSHNQYYTYIFLSSFFFRFYKTSLTTIKKETAQTNFNNMFLSEVKIENKIKTTIIMTTTKKE